MRVSTQKKGVTTQKKGVTSCTCVYKECGGGPFISVSTVTASSSEKVTAHFFTETQQQVVDNISRYHRQPSCLWLFPGSKFCRLESSYNA